MRPVNSANIIALAKVIFGWELQTGAGKTQAAADSYSMRFTRTREGACKTQTVELFTFGLFLVRGNDWAILKNTARGLPLPILRSVSISTS